MQAEVISFRPGSELYAIIMADCNNKDINTTEWVLRKIYAAMGAEKELERIKETLEYSIYVLEEEMEVEMTIDVLKKLHNSLT